MAGKINLTRNWIYGSSNTNVISLPNHSEFEVSADGNMVVEANLVRVRSWEEEISRLPKEFPELSRAPSDALIEVAHRMKGVSEPEGLSIFRNSRLGSWLQSQKATDWVNIGLAIWKTGRD